VSLAEAKACFHLLIYLISNGYYDQETLTDGDIGYIVKVLFCVLLTA